MNGVRKGQLHEGRTPGCQPSLQNPGTSSGHIAIGQMCCVLEDVFTPQLVKTVVKEIMKVQPSKQFRSLACCSMMVDSKNRTQHLVAPEISTEDQTIQADAHRRLSQEEQRPCDLASEHERAATRTMLFRLQWNFAIPILKKHAHRLIIATAKKFGCSTCE